MNQNYTAVLKQDIKSTPFLPAAASQAYSMDESIAEAMAQRGS
jgi:hypothetical protein